jgi:tRNA(fMet)-specific endonuclease VapC
MPRLMLDTNICIYAMRKRPAALQRRLESFDPSEVAISCVVLAELWSGVMKSQLRLRSEAALLAFLTRVTVLDWPTGAARIYGSIRAHLEHRGTPIGAEDMLIAAHALHEDLPLVTNNRAEFSRVPGLKVESWIR